MSQSVLTTDTVDMTFGEQEEEAALRRVSSLAILVREQLTTDWSAHEHLADVCRYALSAPGKYFRPILLLESAAAVGGDANRVMSAAAGAEGAHVASLMHDDIIDGDQMRRGMPAAHVVFGRDDAIVGGDALIFYLFGALAECGRRGVESWRIVESMASAATAGMDLCRGQMMEELIRSSYDTSIDSYLAMIEHKTGALFRASCHIGALLGGGGPAQVDALARYGTALGIAFQITDDLLPYLSSNAKTGKTQSSDLENQRLTLPFLLCRARAHDELVGQLDELMKGESDVELRHLQLADLLTETGSIEEAHQTAKRYATEAIDALSVIPDCESKDSMVFFAKGAVNRWR